MSIREGLYVVKEHNITRLELETDAQVLKFMLDRAENYLHPKLHALIQDDVHLLKEIDTVTILHARRDVNVLAHRMAKLGMEMKEERNVYFTPLVDVMNEFLMDINDTGSTTRPSTSG